MGNSSSSGIIKGLIIGFLLFMLLSRKSEAQPLNSDKQREQNYGFMKQEEPVTIYNWKPLAHIPSISDLKLPVHTSVQQVQPLCPCSEKVQKVEEPSMKPVQENEENWDFKTDSKGRITGVSVHRKLYSVDDKDKK